LWRQDVNDCRELLDFPLRYAQADSVRKKILFCAFTARLKRRVLTLVLTVDTKSRPMRNLETVRQTV